MRLVFAIYVIITLLMLKHVTSKTCDYSPWSNYAKCPRRNMYLRSVSTRGYFDEMLAKVRCCEADDPSYANQSVECVTARRGMFR